MESNLVEVRIGYGTEIVDLYDYESEVLNFVVDNQEIYIHNILDSCNIDVLDYINPSELAHNLVYTTNKQNILEELELQIKKYKKLYNENKGVK